MRRFVGTRPRRSIVALLACVGLFALIASPVRADTGGSPSKSSQSAPALSATAQASADAQQSGQSQPVEGGTGTDYQILANPDGTFTANLSSGPVREPDPANPGAWLPIDLGLQHVSNAFVPAVSDAAISFSDGGTGSLASVAQDGNKVTLDWLASLPTPTISGPLATYANIQPGVDMTLRATPDGLEQAFVVNSAPTGQLTFQIPLSLRHLTATQGASGGIVLTDSLGKQVGGADPATMFGATAGEAEPTASEQVPIDLVTTAGGLMLSESPDMSFFTRPDVTYPVTIDPGTSISINTDTYVESGPSAGYTFSTDTRLKSGLNGNKIDRTLMQFAWPSALNGVHVLSADLSLYEEFSSGCTPTLVNLYNAQGTINSGSTWNNQPTQLTRYAQVSSAAGNTIAPCNNPNAQIDFTTGGASGNTLTDLLQRWSNGQSTGYGVIIQAADETDANAFKKFDSTENGSHQPALSITYNSYPLIPSSVSADSPLPNPILHATFVDPDGGTGQVLYTIRDSAGSVVIQDAGGVVVNSGSDSPYTIPTGTLTAGQDYTWTARSYDGIDYSLSNALATPVTIGDLSTDPPLQPSQDPGIAGTWRDPACEIDGNSIADGPSCTPPSDAPIGDPGLNTCTGAVFCEATYADMQAAGFDTSDLVSEDTQAVADLAAQSIQAGTDGTAYEAWVNWGNWAVIAGKCAGTVKDLGRCAWLFHKYIICPSGHPCTGPFVTAFASRSGDNSPSDKWVRNLGPIPDSFKKCDSSGCSVTRIDHRWGRMNGVFTGFESSSDARFDPGLWRLDPWVIHKPTDTSIWRSAFEIHGGVGTHRLLLSRTLGCVRLSHDGILGLKAKWDYRTSNKGSADMYAYYH